MNIGSTSTETRAQRRRHDTTARVLAAATDLFARQGFAETSMASIADEADVSVGTLYNLFENKDELYRKLIDGKVEKFHARFIAAIERGASPRESLDHFLEEHLRMCVDEATFIRLYYSVNSTARFSLRASLGDASLELYDDGLARFAQVLEKGAQAGQFDLPSTPYRTAVCCQSIVNELLLLYSDDPEQHPAEIVFEEIKRIVYRTVLATAPDQLPRGGAKEKRT